MDKKVDLVMTAFNSAGFIERSLDSVLRQTVRPHVIVVDDASTDGTAELVEAYAERTGLDVELLRLPENLGAGLAKRIGIQRSKADFVTFLDSDDILPKRAIEGMLDLQIKFDADLVCGGVVKVKDGNIVHIENGDFIVFDDGREAFIRFMKFNLCNLFANSKLIRKCTLDLCPPYSSNRFEEDTDSVYHWFWNSRSIVVDTLNPYYIYNLREGSLCNSGDTPEKFEDSLSAMERLVDFVEEKKVCKSSLDGLFINSSRLVNMSKNLCLNKDLIFRLHEVIEKMGFSRIF